MIGHYTGVKEILKNGGVVFMPSDTIYGLSCLALNEQAVQRIHKLKGRDYGKPLIVLLADIGQAAELGLDPKNLEPIRNIWPAPLTVIIPTGQNTPKFLHRGTNTLAVRVPNNKELRQLIKEIGPIVSTSANTEGAKPAETVEEAKEYFGDKLDFYLDIGDLKGQPSTLAIIKNGQLEIVRPGAYKL